MGRRQLPVGEVDDLLLVDGGVVVHHHPSDQGIRRGGNHGGVRGDRQKIPGPPDRRVHRGAVRKTVNSGAVRGVHQGDVEEGIDDEVLAVDRVRHEMGFGGRSHVEDVALVRRRRDLDEGPAGLEIDSDHVVGRLFEELEHVPLEDHVSTGIENQEWRPIGGDVDVEIPVDGAVAIGEEEKGNGERLLGWEIVEAGDREMIPY